MPARKTTEQMIEVMQAFADGKAIQCCPRSVEGYWCDIKKSIWAWDTFDYRIKPEVGTAHNFKIGDKVILKVSCKGLALTQNDICKVEDVNNNSLRLDISNLPYCPNDFVKVDDVLWYWEHIDKDGDWVHTVIRYSKEDIFLKYSDFKDTLTPLYALGAHLPKSEAKDE